MSTRTYKSKNLTYTLAIIFFSLVAACSKTVSETDPYEKYNRKVFYFNTKVDKFIIRPVAKVYDTVIPDQVEGRITNVFDNLDEITTIGNDILQLELMQAISDSWRFFVNSTFGVLGIFDVADEMGLDKNTQRFSGTLAKWGYSDSPYLVLPFLGSSTVYDTISYPVDGWYLSPWKQIEPRSKAEDLFALKAINYRSAMLPYDKNIDKAFDSYIFVRNAFLQRRSQITNQDTD